MIYAEFDALLSEHPFLALHDRRKMTIINGMIERIFRGNDYGRKQDRTKYSR